jgi:hypothetical protein
VRIRYYFLHTVSVYQFAVLNGTSSTVSSHTMKPCDKHQIHNSLQDSANNIICKFSINTHFIIFTTSESDQVASQLLLTLYRFKQRFEITGSKTREVVSLYDLDENGWTIHQVLTNLISIHSSAQLLLIFTLVKSCSRYPPSSKSMRISRLFSVSKSSFKTMPCFFNLIFVLP